MTPKANSHIWYLIYGKKFFKILFRNFQKFVVIFNQDTIFKTFLWYVGESVRFSSFRHELSLESWFLFQNFQRWNLFFFRSTLEDFFSGSPKIRSSGSLNLTSGWFFVFMVNSSSNFLGILQSFIFSSCYSLSLIKYFKLIEI